MIFISILILIVAIALPSFNKQLSPILFIRISSIIFLYAGALSFNAFYIQSIGSGIGIYSGLFHVTIVSQLLEVFLLIIGSIILISWPLNNSIFLKLKNFSHIKNSTQFINKNDKIQDVTVTKINNQISYGTEYSLIVLFSTLGASLLVSSSDLISMYLSIELQSFGLYILATLFRESESATSAGLKYFLLGGLSSCLILFGIGLIYTFTGLTNFESIYSLISVSDSDNIIQGLSLGFIFIIVGFLFKIAAAPLHNWAPDVYDDSPTIVTIWLTIMPKISIIILLIELQTHIGIIGGLTSFSFTSNLELLESVILNHTKMEVMTLLIGENTIYVLKLLFLISSLLSLIIGTVVGLAQTRIKRLLAYSTISHIGFILLALSINTEQSIDSLIFYIIQYTITNLNAFLILLALGYTLINKIERLDNINPLNNFNRELGINYTKGLLRESIKDIKFIYELKGQFLFNPLLSLSFTICLLSMAGIPPLIGFFSKQFVLYSAIQNGYYFMSILAILVSVISASYYLKIIRVLHTNAEDNLQLKNVNYKLKDEDIHSSVITQSNLINKNNKYENSSESVLTNFHSFLISSLTLTILLFVLKPSIILNITQLLSLSLYKF